MLLAGMSIRVIVSGKDELWLLFYMLQLAAQPQTGKYCFHCYSTHTPQSQAIISDFNWRETLLLSQPNSVILALISSAWIGRYYWKNWEAFDCSDVMQYQCMIPRICWYAGLSVLSSLPSDIITKWQNSLYRN